MSVARMLRQMRALNGALQRAPCPHPLLLAADVKAELFASLSLDGRLQGATTAELAALGRLAVESAERLVILETSGALQACDPTSVGMVAVAASCCALLATACQLPAADAARVQGAVAVSLGSGRRALQALAQLSDSSAGNIRDLGADLLDSMQMFAKLVINRGNFGSFATRAAPPSRLLAWIQDAAAVLNRLGGFSSAAVGCLLSPLTSFAYVLSLATDSAAQQYSSIHAALTAPSLVQPLLLGLAEAPPALRGECSPMHNQDGWALVSFVGLSLSVLGPQPGAAALCTLSCHARPGAPTLMELVRDAAAALPPSPPAFLPMQNFLLAHTCLCSMLVLLSPAVVAAGSSAAASVPLVAAGWAAMQAFATLGPRIRSLAAPPNPDTACLLSTAGSAVYAAVGSLLQLLDVLAGGCRSRQQLQLISETAWEAASQLPLQLAAAASEAAWPSGGDSRTAAMFIAPVQALLIAARQQLAATPWHSAAGSRQPPGEEEAAAMSAAATQLLEQTHLRLCKLAHFLVAAVPADQRPVQAALAGPQAKQAVAQLLAQCFDTLQLAWARSKDGSSGSSSSSQAGSAGGEEPDSAPQQRRLAHAAAQWEAVQVLAAQGALPPQAAVIASVGVPPLDSVVYSSFHRLLACSPEAVRSSPWLRLVAPALTYTFQKLGEGAQSIAEENAFYQEVYRGIVPEQQEVVVQEVEIDILAFTLQQLAADGGLTASLLSHPQLPGLLDHVAKKSASDKKFGALVQQLSAALHSMLAAAAAVKAAAVAGGEEGGISAQDTQAPAAGLAELAAAAAGLEAAMAAEAFPAPPARPQPGSSRFTLPTWMAAHAHLYRSGSGRAATAHPIGSASRSAGSGSTSQAAASSAPSGPTPKVSLAAFRATLLPHALRLAAALLPHWPLAGQQRMERLQLARAVLACCPGCSNLHCPDWQGLRKKPLRCAGCRQARFCNAACQAEAWRQGGHKDVCKLLLPADAGV